MPANAPGRIIPSRPMLITPERSAKVSPRAASSKGVVATRVEWSRASLLVRSVSRASILQGAGGGGQEAQGEPEERWAVRAPASPALPYGLGAVGGQEKYHGGLDDGHQHRGDAGGPLHGAGARLQRAEEYGGEHHPAGGTHGHPAHRYD